MPTTQRLLSRIDISLLTSKSQPPVAVVCLAAETRRQDALPRRVKRNVPYRADGDVTFYLATGLFGSEVLPFAPPAPPQALARTYNLLLV